MFKIYPKIQRFFNTKPNQENISACARLQTIQKEGYTTIAPIKVRYGEEKAKISVYLQKICGGVAKINSHAKDKHNNLLGKYDYLIDNQDRTINYGYIETSHGNRRRGIGEILRLTSLIMLKENNLNTIKLEAFSEAIPFHFKYKFSPDLELKKTAESILSEIKYKPFVSNSFREKAKRLITQILSDDNFLSPKNRHDVNQFIENYIKKNLSNWQDAKFSENLPMELSINKINENAEFFNKLFKKHSIDYTI